jgi:hypothetical protein
VQPNDLAPAVNIELVVITAIAIHFVNSTDVGLALFKGIRQARVKVRSENRSD